jgi:hypothetical protein
MTDQKVSKQILQDWKRVISAVQLEAKVRNEYTIAFLLEMAVEEISTNLSKEKIKQLKVVIRDNGAE